MINYQKVAALWLFTALCSGQTAPAFLISSVAGNYTRGYSGDDSTATAAQLNTPMALALDSSGTLYISDTFNSRVRKVTAEGIISTFAGNGTAGYTGDGGQATSAEIYDPGGIAVDPSGNVYIADTGASVVRSISRGGSIATLAGSNANAGFGGDGGKAKDAQLLKPNGLAVDAAGNVYIADTANQRIRKISSDGIIRTVAGNGGAGFCGDGGWATDACLNNPRGIAVDTQGNLYIADTLNHRVRKVDASGIITTVAGTSTRGYCGDLDAATKACLNYPWGVAVDKQGYLYIADYSNSRIRRVTPNGIIATVAGNGRFASTGDGGDATHAALYFPTHVAVSDSGKVYIADSQNQTVRMLTPNPDARPAIVPGGITTLTEYGGAAGGAPGSWIEIHGSNFSASERSATDADFSGDQGPTTLNGVSVTVGGQTAPVFSVSASKIKAQVPFSIGMGPQEVVVTTTIGSSEPSPISIRPSQASVFAPSFLKAGETQYAALLADGATYAAPAGAFPKVSTAPAKPGDTLRFYGIGFGAVTPDIAAGQKTGNSHTLRSPLSVLIDGVPATVTFAELKVSEVGIYQIDVIVPEVSPGDAVPVALTLDGVTGQQFLFIAVQ